MLFELNFKSGKPAYLQLVEQVRYAAASGAIREGEALPSIRVLAERLRINRNTVAKAYSEMEHQGLVEVIQGKGVFLSGNISPFSRKVRKAALRESVDALLVEAHHLQFSHEELLELIEERAEHFGEKTAIQGDSPPGGE